MNISHILRGLLDIIEKNQADDSEIELTPVRVDNTDNTDTNTMVPPLQQNLELLKRAVDVPNYYGDAEGGDCGCDGVDGQDGESSDELDRIKHIAGVPTAAIATMTGTQPI